MVFRLSFINSKLDLLNKSYANRLFGHRRVFTAYFYNLTNENRILFFFIIII